MSNVARGNTFCIASPHHKSSLTGMAEYLASQHAPTAALSCAVSLTQTLPHLCGFGGDAIIMEKHHDDLRSFNGTGKTGTHQHWSAYQDRGLSAVPRRGAYSTMVYGAPAAFNGYVRTHSIDLPGVVGRMLQAPLDGAPVWSSALDKAFGHAELPYAGASEFENWHRCLSRQSASMPGYRALLAQIASEGFHSFYRGDIAAQVYRTLSNAAPGIYVPSDFSAFSANPTEIKRMTFGDAEVCAHGSNSPWRELFLLLKVYERAAQEGHSLSEAQRCHAAGWIDSAARAMDESAAGLGAAGSGAGGGASLLDRALKEKSASVYDIVTQRDAQVVAQSHKPAHTIFLACATQNGQLIGITNSIFTPLGALVEIEDTGLLLSNRCFSFNGPDYANRFNGGSAAKHTNNCVHVRTKDIEFIIGTSGGPVQSQTLASIIDRVVLQHESLPQAVSCARCANLGIHPKTGQVTYVSESASAQTPFTSLGGLSDKLGVVQVAGRCLKTGHVFAVADPRGDGVALGL